MRVFPPPAPRQPALARLQAVIFLPAVQPLDAAIELGLSFALPQQVAHLTLNACVQTLFGGRCERPGGATYGRWMQQTLRLVPGKVEVSGDNRSFRPLAEQAQNCSISSIG